MDRRRRMMAPGTGGIAMTSSDPDRSKTDGKPDRGQPRPESLGWSLFSYMVGGMLLYGGIGWLVGRWTNLPVLFPVGMIVGLALAIVLIIFRVTRS